MMGHISIHDKYKIASRALDAVNIGSTKPKFPRTRTKDDFVFAIDMFELLSNLDGVIWRVIIDDDNLIVQTTWTHVAKNEVDSPMKAVDKSPICTYRHPNEHGYE